MPIPDRFEIGFCKEMVCGVIFGVEYQILTKKTNVLGKMAFCGVYVWPFCGSDGAPQWLGMIDMPIPDR